jgi:hypothetical protein
MIYIVIYYDNYYITYIYIYISMPVESCIYMYHDDIVMLLHISHTYIYIEFMMIHIEDIHIVIHQYDHTYGLYVTSKRERERDIL